MIDSINSDQASDTLASFRLIEDTGESMSPSSADSDNPYKSPAVGVDSPRTEEPQKTFGRLTRFVIGFISVAFVAFVICVVGFYILFLVSDGR